MGDVRRGRKIYYTYLYLVSHAQSHMDFLELMNGQKMSRRTDLHFASVWQATGWGMVVAVIWLSLTPNPPHPPAMLTWDKAHHLLAYTALMFWFAQSFARHWRWPVFLCGLGFTLEVLQGLGGVRSFDLFDLVANVLGVTLGLVLAMTPLGRVLLALDRGLATRLA